MHTLRCVQIKLESWQLQSCYTARRDRRARVTTDEERVLPEDWSDGRDWSDDTFCRRSQYWVTRVPACASAEALYGVLASPKAVMCNGVLQSHRQQCRQHQYSWCTAIYWPAWVCAVLPLASNSPCCKQSSRVPRENQWCECRAMSNKYQLPDCNIF